MKQVICIDDDWRMGDGTPVDVPTPEIGDICTVIVTHAIGGINFYLLKEFPTAMYDQLSFADLSDLDEVSIHALEAVNS